jgi:hypothetical protein
LKLNRYSFGFNLQNRYWAGHPEGVNMSFHEKRFSELLTEYLSFREDCQRPDCERPGSIDDRAAQQKHAFTLLEEMDKLVHGSGLLETPE